MVRNRLALLNLTIYSATGSDGLAEHEVCLTFEVLCKF